MRIAMVFVAVLFIDCGSINIWAQDSGMNGLAGQIREQERMVETASGQKDGAAWFKLAVLCQDAARYRDSERAYRRAIPLLKPGAQAIFADALDHMGTMYMETNRLDKSESFERRALVIREKQDDLLGIGISHTHLSALMLGKHEYVSAESEADMAVSLLAPAQAHPAVQTAATPEEQMTALIDLSLARCARQACASAVAVLRRALEIAHANYAANSVPVGMLDFLLGYALWKSGETVSAGDQMRNGTQELASQLGWGHPTYVRILRQYETFLIQIGRAAEAGQVSARIASLERSTGSASKRHAGSEIGLLQIY